MCCRGTCDTIHALLQWDGTVGIIGHDPEVQLAEPTFDYAGNALIVKVRKHPCLDDLMNGTC